MRSLPSQLCTNFAARMKDILMNELISLLHQGRYSCVIRHQSEVRTFSSRGIFDLFRLLRDEPGFLRGACVADKVVGKGAAALMVLGGVKAVHADVVSSPALAVLRSAGIDIQFDTEVPHIQNRQGTGWCPVEKLCRDLSAPEDMLPLIAHFVEKASGRSAAR